MAAIITVQSEKTNRKYLWLFNLQFEICDFQFATKQDAHKMRLKHRQRLYTPRFLKAVVDYIIQ
jgi:hypothetical protein